LGETRIAWSGYSPGGYGFLLEKFSGYLESLDKFHKNFLKPHNFPP
jgi:hypothetical protein